VWKEFKTTKLCKGIRPLPEDLTTAMAVGGSMCTATPAWYERIPQFYMASSSPECGQERAGIEKHVLAN